MSITGIRGFNDILPEECAVWRRIEDEAVRVFTAFGFSEIRLPVVEKTELFLRSIGETTDIVEKQMYTFSDRHGESLALRPEGTAPLVRAYIEKRLYAASPATRLFYMGPMFRYERPQKGRYRQFHQIGAEVLGTESPMADAEALKMLETLFVSLGISGVEIEINSLGCPRCRPAYKEELKGFLADKTERLCDNCKGRIGKNPLRALDCKTPGCLTATHGAPAVSDFLCDACGGHFKGLRSALDMLGVAAKVNPRMVRGLDYYTRTTFEVTSGAGTLGAQNAIAAGGRYDGLVEELGGPATPCFGFAIGMERLALLVDRNRVEKRPLVLFLAMGDGAGEKGVEVAARLRDAGLRVVADYAEGSLKSRMKRADRMGAGYVIILGEDEIREGVLTVKDMTTGAQEKIAQDKIPALIKGRSQGAQA
ncbi:MAG: histidine--tRNA ligase [Deltaproteobacteria bacterium]|nr:histidine--tRNA ligase [Deltaproteobacteria bacterium]